MNITPDQARELLDGARPGPWYVHTVPDDPDGTFIYDETGNMCISVEPAGSDYREADLALAAAAPDLAQTIAGMEWQYAVEVYNAAAKRWIQGINWISNKELAEQYLGDYGDDRTRLVRRLVGPTETVGELV